MVKEVDTTTMLPLLPISRHGDAPRMMACRTVEVRHGCTTRSMWKHNGRTTRAHVRGPDGEYCAAEGRGKRSTLLELVNGNKSLDVIVQDYPG